MLFVSTLEKVPVWVDSSPKGKGFYAKLGFQPVEVTTLDLSLGSKGLTGWHEITLMRWAPPDVTKEE